MEIFVGVEAFAGLCCIISEILMIISIHVYEKKDKRLDATKAKNTIESSTLPATLDKVDIKTINEKKEKEMEKPKQCPLLQKENLSTTVHQLHALVITVLVANMHYLPFLGIVPVFFTAGMSVTETLSHWFAACVSIGVYTLAFAFFKAR